MTYWAKDAVSCAVIRCLVFTPAHGIIVVEHEQKQIARKVNLPGFRTRGFDLLPFVRGACSVMNFSSCVFYFRGDMRYILGSACAACLEVSCTTDAHPSPVLPAVSESILAGGYPGGKKEVKMAPCPDNGWQCAHEVVNIPRERTVFVNKITGC